MLIDYSNTFVILIGDSHPNGDEDLCPIPNVEVNLQSIKKYFTDENYIKIPEVNITESLNDPKAIVERKLRDSARQADKPLCTLIVYYCGHGILSTIDYTLYLSTPTTTRDDLDIEGVSINILKNHLNRSRAGRKIVILDCCHSGYFISQMGDKISTLQANIDDFRGSYVITSAPEDQPALFPVDQPEAPTYFTGKLLDVIENGLENDSEYCSLRDIYQAIRDFSYDQRLPLPQQSFHNEADRLDLCKNRKYELKKNQTNPDWDEAEKANSKITYFKIISKYPNSVYADMAQENILLLDEAAEWPHTLSTGTRNAFEYFLERFPNGKYKSLALGHLNRLLLQEKQNAENDQIQWGLAIADGTPDSYTRYINNGHNDRHLNEARSKIDLFKALETEKEKLRFQKLLRKGIIGGIIVIAVLVAGYFVIKLVSPNSKTQKFLANRRPVKDDTTDLKSSSTGFRTKSQVKPKSNDSTLKKPLHANETESVEKHKIKKKKSSNEKLNVPAVNTSSKIKPLNSIQWIKQGNTIQFEHIFIKLDSLDSKKGLINVHLCYTDGIYTCENDLSSVLINLGRYYSFTFKGTNYNLYFISTDHAGTDYSTLAVFLTLKKNEVK